MRISTSLLYQRGVDAMEGQQAKLSATQEQLATGERLKSPADDPFASTRIVVLDEQDKTLDQYDRNSGFAKARLEVEENALSSIMNILQRLNELAVQTANGTLSANDRIATSEEVFRQLDGLLQISNSRDASGEYIFSGDRTDTPAFTDNGGSYTFNGDQGQRKVQIGSDRQVATGDSGYEVFLNIDDGAGGSKDLLQIVYDFASTIGAGNPSPGSIMEISNAMQRITGFMAKVGGRINAIDSQVNSNDAFSVAINKTRSSLEDLDYAEAISRFRQELAGLEAAQQSFIQIQNLSLFNFL